jgi:hypothetical protein
MRITSLRNLLEGLFRINMLHGCLYIHRLYAELPASGHAVVEIFAVVIEFDASRLTPYKASTKAIRYGAIAI